MRLRTRRPRRASPESTPAFVDDPVEVEATTPVSWSVEQLHSLGPVTGPGHRTFVPIVRSTLRGGSLEGPTGS
jgi:hypothetical protein